MPPATNERGPAVPEETQLDAEDAKLITLARSARVRNAAAEGAAVRDDTGRTYVATTVSLASLRLSAVQVAVAMAVASGASGLEAAAVVTESDAVADDDRAVVTELGPTASIFVADSRGDLRSTIAG